MGAETPSAFAGAIIFETGGFFAAQAQHIGAILAVAPMPLAWLCVLRLRRTPTFGWAAVLALSLGLSILGGLPQATVAVFGSTVVLTLVVARRRVPIVAAACLLGLGLAAIIFLPTWQVTQYSVAKYRADWLGTGGGLHWAAFASLVLPNYYHLFDLSRFKGPGDISFLYLYGSFAGLALAIFCLVTRLRDMWARTLALMLAFGGIWMLGDKTALWRLLFPLLPVSVRIGIHPEFTFCIFTLAFAGLAALGLQRWRVPDGVRWAVALLIATDLFLVGSGRPMNATSVLEEPGLTRESLDGSTELLASVRSFVNRSKPPDRIDTMEASMAWAECATLTRVPTANGSSPLALENIVKLQLRALEKPGVRWGWYYQVENPNSPVLDIMNVRYLVASGKAIERLRSNPRYRHAASLPGNELYENLTVLPRYFLVSDVRVGGDESLSGIDLHRTALVDRAIPMALSPGPADGCIQAMRYEPDSLELAVESPRPAFLVLSEAFYPGWQARIDNVESEIYRTDVAFRGVLLPAGAHRVRLEFRPTIFRLGRFITGISAGALLALLFVRKRTIY
jgi:hypothetical protein